MRAREIKWAMGGFIGGFLICYLLIGEYRSPSPAPRLLPEARSTSVWVPVQQVVTNIRLPEVRLGSRGRWVEPESGLRPASAPKPPGYSLDLIDTDYQMPKE